MVRVLGTWLVALALVAGCESSVVSPTSQAPAVVSPAAPASPSSGPAASPEAGASPSPSPVVLDELAWRRVGTIEAASVDDLVGFAAGYVALDAQRGRVWFSADGQAWRRIALPRSSGQARDPNGQVAQAVATDGTRVLVVGGYSHRPCGLTAPGDTGGGPDCALSPISWVSRDGVHWKQGTSSPADSGLNQFVSAWPVTSGGWDAAVEEWTGEARTGRAIWHSPDGIRWRRLGRLPRSGERPVDGPWYHAGTGGVGRERMAWSEWLHFDPALEEGDSRWIVTVAHSANGRDWTRLDAFPGTTGHVTRALGPADGGTRWVVAGGTGAIGESPSAPVIWTTNRLDAWTTVELPVGPLPAGLPARATVSEVTGLVRADTGFVAVGAANTRRAASHETWLSDNGLTWRQLPSPGREPGDFGPWLVADGPAGVIGIARTADRPARLAVWQLR